MVARSPPKLGREMAAAAVVAPPHPDPTLLRETVKKVDRCMVRLQELHYTVAGGRKVISGTRLSPTSTRTYLRTSESLKIKNGNPRRSPSGKLPTNTEEWRRMSLPAMLLGETVGEILQASQFARNIVEAASSNTRKAPPAGDDDPTTPETVRRKQKETMENCQLHARRKREKQQVVLQATRSESDMSSSQRAKSRINFKKTEFEAENCSSRYIANRVSPRNRPWARKTVLFPNPLFHSSSHSSSHHPNFSKTNSPVIPRNRQNATKFMIKPLHTTTASQFQLSLSPTPAATTKSARPAAMLRRSFSPARLAKRKSETVHRPTEMHLRQQQS